MKIMVIELNWLHLRMRCSHCFRLSGLFPPLDGRGNAVPILCDSDAHPRVKERDDILGGNDDLLGTDRNLIDGFVLKGDCALRPNPRMGMSATLATASALWSLPRFSDYQHYLRS